MPRFVIPAIDGGLLARLLALGLLALSLIVLGGNATAQTAPRAASSSASAATGAPRALFYLMGTQKSRNSFYAHADKIDLLVPTWYGVDAHGLVNGAPDPRVLATAKSKGLPVMPILSMTAGREGFHKLLQDEGAQREMNTALLREAKEHGYVGFQYDFESIAWTDRDAFTKMAKSTADLLHKNKLQFTIAVVPNAPGHAGEGPFSKWMWEYWRGNFDLAALAKFCDLISLMTYDQHTRWTAPGPVDGWQWMVDHLDYALKVVPKEKLSLGIATYGYHWFTGNPVKEDGKEVQNISADYIDYDESAPLAQTYGAKIQWDEVDRESYYWFYRDQMREWVFMPDARSFRERYELVKRSGIDGFSSWVLGAEDPAIWDVLPNVR